MFIMLTKYSLGLKLIMYLKLAQQSVIGTQYVMDDLFNSFCTELSTVIFFVVTKDKFEVLHLTDLLLQ